MGSNGWPRQATELLDEWSLRRPEAEAVVCGETRLSYGQLRESVDLWAKALLAMGVRRGDRVAVLTTPRAEFVVLFLALARIGATWVGLNPRHRLPELRYVVEDTEPVLLFCLDRFEQRSYEEEARALTDECESISELISLGGPIEGAVSSAEFAALGRGVQPARLEEAAALSAADDPACVVYTSGSTGQPKGAVLSHSGLLMTHRAMAERCAVESPCLISDLPIDHVAGIGFVYTTLASGGKLVLRERFDPVGSLTAIEEERVSVWFAETTQFLLALPHAARHDLSSLETIGYTTTPPRSVLEQLGVLAERLICGYGMTETSDLVLMTEPGEDFDSLARGNVGRPIAGVEARLVEASGADRGAGELQVRGACVFAGYLNRPEATAEAFAEGGWLRTGDLLRATENGSFEFVGRLGSGFRSGGYNVYPEEIERALEAHPGVVQAAVVDVADEVFGAVGHAFVLARPGAEPGAEELEAHCRERLANYKVPKAFTVALELPMTRTEKINKKELRARTERQPPETSSPASRAQLVAPRPGGSR